ncbi:MAG TPA: thiamine-phosphate kinase [Terriglobales bacterium]|nr:thiamine-phosphate kinase [Terriglobales bacterium]
MLTGSGVLTEDQLVRKIAKTARFISRQQPSRGLRLAIGDDAAVLSAGGRTEWAVSCDAFLEGVHFLPKIHPPDSVGYKSVVRAASDLVAMGATPRYFLITLALPASRTGKWLDGFLAGMSRAARHLGMQLIGGDTTENRTVFLSVTVLGETSSGRALTRSGAKPGDLIFVTGKLGRAQLGLDLLRTKRVPRSGRGVLRFHLYPVVNARLGEWLSRSRVPSAVMDISDGLSTDLGRLCAASRVGARIEAKRIPHVVIPKSVSLLAQKLKLDPLEMALHGGDDYGLLFTVPPRKASRLRRAPDFADITCIGEVTAARQILLLSGKGSALSLKKLGWDPFRRK